MIAIRTETDDSNKIINDFNKISEIFTLAYLKSHEILIDDQTDLKKNDYSCFITVLFPFDESKPILRADINDILEKYIYLKMTVSSNNEIFYRKNKFTTHKRTRRSGDKKFLELEFREGPISVYKSDKLTENITCHLKLMDSEDQQTTFENTIEKMYQYRHTNDFTTKSASITENSTSGSSVKNKSIERVYYILISAIIFLIFILILIIIYTIIRFRCDGFKNSETYDYYA